MALMLMALQTVQTLSTIVWPFAGIGSSPESTSPQTEQRVPAVLPRSVQVASVAATVSTVCPLAEDSTVPQNTQICGSVQVGPPPGVCSFLGTDSVLVSPHSVQVYTTSPACAQVASVLTVPSSQAWPEASTVTVSRESSSPHTAQ